MKVLNIIEKVMIAILLVVMVALIGVAFLPRLFGYQPYTVISGSMEPKYHVGCIVYVKPIEFDEIEVGDALTLRLGDSANSTPFTHEVIEINKENKTITTQGIANDNADGESSYSRVIGKATDFSIPYAGYVLNWASSSSAKIIFITYLVLVVIIMVAQSLLKKVSYDDEKEDTTKKE